MLPPVPVVDREVLPEGPAVADSVADHPTLDRSTFLPVGFFLQIDNGL